MIYFKSVLHKAFINVNRNKPTPKPSPPPQIPHLLPTPTRLIIPQPPRHQLHLQPQIRTHNIRIRLPHTYPSLNPGIVKYMNASLSVYIYSLILLDRAQ